MKTRAMRLYGKNDIRTEEFELPEMKEDEILAKVICDSICMSSHKAAMQGAAHKRVPDNVAENPIILGHEFCGETIDVPVSSSQYEFFHGALLLVHPSVLSLS